MTENFRTAFFLSAFAIFATAASGQEVLTLDEAVAVTMQNNFDIRMARTSAEIETENNTLGNAGFLPTVDAMFLQEYDLNNVRQQFVSGDIQEGTGLQNERMNFAVMMDWTVFGGFAAVTNSQRLDIFEKQGEIETRMQVENTLMELFSVYYEAVSLKKQIDAVQSAIEISSQRLTFAEKERSLGAGSGLQVLQARVDMNTDSAALVRQEYELRRVKSVINELMGRAPDTEFETESEIRLGELMAFDDLSRQASVSNAELFAARNEAEVSKLDVRTAQSTYYPEVALQGLYNFQTSESEAGFLVNSRLSGLTYGLTARWTLFGGLNNRREAKVAKLRSDIARDNLAMSELRLQGELYRVYESYLMARRLFSLEQRSADVANENLEIVTEQMKLGSINALELREAQRNMVDAEFRLIQAGYEAKMAEADLLRISGELTK